jgi:putative ABC transport system ATP-binding protein
MTVIERPAETEAVPAPAALGPALISARSLSKVYRVGEQDLVALDDVTLDIAEGDFVAIMGPSGSGKSTMMNLIGALDVPSGGQLVFDGRDIGTLSVDELADLRNRSIGFVFQQFNLLPRTSALRQVMLPLLYAHPRPDDSEGMARRRLEQVGLANRLDHTPRQLSGGQQQRVAIARALVNNPKLLLADEPTGALDSRTSEEIMQVFTELNRSGITVVLVTHEPEIALWAGRRITFRDGRIVDDVRQTPYFAGATSRPDAGPLPAPIPVSAAGAAS